MRASVDVFRMKIVRLFESMLCGDLHVSLDEVSEREHLLMCFKLKPSRFQDSLACCPNSFQFSLIC